jgi:hypothetical protein
MSLITPQEHFSNLLKNKGAGANAPMLDAYSKVRKMESDKFANFGKKDKNGKKNK